MSQQTSDTHLATRRVLRAALTLLLGAAAAGACDMPQTPTPPPAFGPTMSLEPLAPSTALTGICNKNHKGDRAGCEADAGCEWLISNGHGYCIEKQKGGLPPMI